MKKTSNLFYGVLFLLSVFCLSAQLSYGQAGASAKYGKIQNNSIYLELLGNGWRSGYTINYERVFFHNHGYYIAGRIGAGYTRYMEVEAATTPIILLNQYYQLYYRILFEASIGWGYFWNFYEDGYCHVHHHRVHFITGTIGFRIQNPKGFLFRIGFTPHYNFTGNNAYFDRWQAMAGISLGYSF